MKRTTCYWFWMLLLLIIQSQSAFGQHETANWLFGQHAYLKFSANGQPVNVAGSALNTPQGCATMSDKQSNLLFYTNGETVWNKQHNIMTNGNGLFGDRNARQPCLIIPKPGSSTKFYIITQEKTANGVHINLCFSEVDMANGLGTVTAATKNTRFFHIPSQTANIYLSEKLTAVKHANGRDYWLLTHQFIGWNYEFLSFKVTPNSISLPVKTQVGVIIGIGRDFKIPFKVSPDSKWLATDFLQRRILYNFNNKTGKISSEVEVNFTQSNKFGMEFSPDSKKVYFSEDGNVIEQYDLTSNDPVIIEGSRKVLGNLNGISNNLYGNLQLASNGKIYIARIGANFLSEIANPNLADTLCNLQIGPQLAPGTLCQTGLPNFISSYFAPSKFTFQNACAGSPVSFTIPDTAYLDSVHWNFGNPTSGAGNTSKLWQAAHTYNAAGTYEATLYTYVEGVETAYKREVSIYKPSVNLVRDTLLCGASQFTLRNAAAKMPYERYKWSTGDTTETLTVIAPGTYRLTISNAYCTSSDSVKVSFGQKPQLTLGNDMLICIGSEVVLQNGLNNTGNLNYLWSTGQTTPAIIVTKPGTYKLEASNGVCSVTDDITVIYNFCPENLFIPNILTLNNDGLNDKLEIKGIEPGSAKLKIFDRWGRQVYASASYQNNWPEKEIMGGIYYYELEQPNTGKIKGWVDVIKVH